MRAAALLSLKEIDEEWRGTDRTNWLTGGAKAWTVQRRETRRVVLIILVSKVED